MSAPRSAATLDRIKMAREMGAQARADGVPRGLINNPEARAFIAKIESRKARVEAMDEYNRGYGA